MSAHAYEETSGLPFDSAKLDTLMERHGLDALVVTSKHNVSYLLGGYRFHFFDQMDAIGLSRYIPAMVYLRGKPDQLAYFGNAMEKLGSDPRQSFVSQVTTGHWGTRDTATSVCDFLRASGVNLSSIGVETGFLPVDFYQVLSDAFPQSRFSDCTIPLERLRAVKSAGEIEALRHASEGAVASMVEAMSRHGDGATKRDIISTVRNHQTQNGLRFEYCLCTLGTSTNRHPDDQVWHSGDTISLDTGCNYHGYIGDLCRMGILGEPDSELEDLLAEVEETQQAARAAVAPGALGREVIEAGQEALARAPHRDRTDFVAHGMGLVSHEAPRLVDDGPVPYPADDAALPLEAGMVTSIETTLVHPSRGFVKLEDTVIVTADGHEALGDTARGWTIAGGAAS